MLSLTSPPIAVTRAADSDSDSRTRDSRTRLIPGGTRTRTRQNLGRVRVRPSFRKFCKCKVQRAPCIFCASLVSRLILFNLRIFFGAKVLHPVLPGCFTNIEEQCLRLTEAREGCAVCITWARHGWLVILSPPPSRISSQQHS